MKINFALWPVIYTATLWTAVAVADDSKLPVLKPKVKTLAAFKNGLGFVFKTSDTQLENGWARTDPLPAAALGTLWIGTTSTTGPVTDVIAYKEKVVEQSDAITQAELLGANVGRRVALTYYTGGTATRVEGTLLAVPLDRKLDEPPAATPVTPAYPAWCSPVEPNRGEIVLLRTSNAGRTVVLSVNKSIIQAVELLDDANLKAKLEKELLRARIHVGGNPKSAEITMAYLEKGIVWSPSYRINIEKEDKAEIALDAVLANDVEDLEAVEVSFVVGYPNFLYADILTPLSLQQTVAAFLQALLADRRGEQSGRFANVMAQSVAYNTANFDASLRPEAAYSTAQPMPGETSEDLYFYRKAGVTIKRGDRARYEMFNATVPYEHLYQWDISDSMNVDDRGHRVDSGSRKEPENHVWHVLRLENTTKQPWTTAPAFAVNGALPVAQDVLNYTPPGGKNTLKLTVATDVRAEQSQTELSRKSINVEGRSFDEVAVSGNLKVTNWKSKPASVLIHKSLVGEVLEAPEGKVTKVARKLTSVNPASDVEWEFPLASGKAKELKYQYKVLIYR